MAQFATLPVDADVGHAAAALQVVDLEHSEFLAPQAVVEERGQDRSVPFPLERVGVGECEKSLGLGVANRRRLAFVGALGGALHAFYDIRRDRILVAEVIEKRIQRGKFGADRRRRDRRRLGLEPVAVRDDVGAGDLAELADVLETHERRELGDVETVRAFRFRVRDVGKPLGLGREFGELVEALLG